MNICERGTKVCIPSDSTFWIRIWLIDSHLRFGMLILETQILETAQIVDCLVGVGITYSIKGEIRVISRSFT